MKKRVEADKKKKQNTTQAKQTRQPKRKKLKVKKPKPELNRETPILSMEGDYLPDMFRSNYLGVPAYDIATGRYINQDINKNSVKCWTRYNKGGNPYTTCFNNDYSIQLRKGQPPKGAKGRKPTKTQLSAQKKRLKPTNREPDLNYILL